MRSEDSQSLSQEREVAEARISGLLEDDREQHEVTFDSMTNLEVLTLSTALNESASKFRTTGAEPQAEFIQGLDVELHEQVPSLFDELEEIHEAVEEEANQSRTTPSGGSGGLGSFFRPFSAEGLPGSNRVWRLGIMLLVIQAVIAMTEVFALLSEDLLGLSLPVVTSPTLTVAFTSIVAVLAVACIGFTAGISYAKFS